MGAERRLVKSRDRTLTILDALSVAQSNLELREIMAYTKLPKSTAYRMLSTLDPRRYVMPAGASGSYRLSAFKMSRYLGSRQCSQDVLAQVALRSSERANLGVLTGSSRANSPHALCYPAGVEGRVAARCSALGTAIPAFASADIGTSVLVRVLALQTQGTIVELAEDVRKVERRGGTELSPGG